MDHKLLDRCIPVDKNILSFVFTELKNVFDKYNIEIIPLGSYLKKNDNELYSDLDIAVNYDFDKRDNIKNILRDNFDLSILQGHENYSLNVMNIGFRISENNYLQVDFMFTDNLEYSSFVYHSPNFSKNESKYKGMYASILLQSIIRNIPLKRDHFEEDGSLKEWSYYSLSQKDGLLIKTKTFIGKKGFRIKSPRVIDERFISKSPKEILELIFGTYDSINYIYTFESLLDYVSSNRFNVISDDFRKEFLERVKNDFLSDWQFEIKTPEELKKEFANLFNDKINNL